MIVDLGLISFEKAYAVQKEFVARRQLGEVGDSLIIAEHLPVFTTGRSGKATNLLVSEESLRHAGIKLERIDRGGDITFHGPGQVVVYPIVDLKRRTKDLHKYLRDLEQGIIRFLSDYRVMGLRRETLTGVWVGDRKIAFIGVACRNWITYHGISININVDLGYFAMIHPCGLCNIDTTSLKALLQRTIDMGEAKAGMAKHLADVFDIKGGRIESAATA